MKFSLLRAEILTEIWEATNKGKGEISISDLAKKMKMSAGTTMYRYLEEMEKTGTIKMRKENKKQGKPTMLSTTSKADPIPKALFEFKDKIEKIWK